MLRFVQITGFKGVGPKNMCKAHEAERAHGQCESAAAEQGRHPGAYTHRTPPTAVVGCPDQRRLRSGLLLSL